MQNLDKNTFMDMKKLLSDSVEGWLIDFDEEFVYYEQWDEDYKVFKSSYTMSEGSRPVIGEDKQEVVKLTEYRDVSSSDEVVTKDWLEKNLNSFLDKHFGGTKSIDVIKQFGEEGGELFAVEPLYLAPGEVDGHGDTIELDTITQMVESLNKANEEGRLQSGLFHKHKTSAWNLDKAWVNPYECKIGDEVIPAGQPIARTIFTSPVMHQMRMDGRISGLSIGAKGERVALDKSLEELKELQEKPEAQHLLKNVNFDWDYPELTYTSPSQGGAASMKNQIYDISKAKKAVESDLDNDQRDLLAELGEEFISLEKHLGVDNDNTPSSSESTEGLVTGEETQLEKGIDEMSENTVTRQEFEDLQKALAVEKAKNALSGYGFDSELGEKVAEAFATLGAESQGAITKAFEDLIQKGEAKVEAEVEKAKKPTPVAQGTEDLQKALDEEAGEGGEPEATVEKSFLDKVMEYQDKGAK